MASRKNFLKMIALGTTGITLGKQLLDGYIPASASQNLPESQSEESLKLGVASYSLREFNRPKTISMIKEIGAEYVNIKSFHIPKDYSPQQLRAARREFEQAGLKIAGGGVVNLREDNDDFFRHHFEYARILGFPVMIVAVTLETLPLLERFAVEYDMKVAIHNHSSSGATFPSPQAIMDYIKDMDPLVGICNDLGHTALNGVDVIESIEASGNRLYDIHLKDLKDLSNRGTQCIIGDGAMPVADIFHKLIQTGYEGVVGLEYEIEPEDPLVAMKQSFAYMRGVVDGLDKIAAN